MKSCVVVRWTASLAIALPVFAAAGDGGSYRLNVRYAPVPGGDVQLAAVSADGEWIVYRADAGAQDNVQNLYSVPADLSAAPVAITGNGDFLQALVEVSISPDGARALYLQRPTGAPKSTLCSVPIDGSAPPVELTGPHVVDYAVTPDSARVVFIGDILVDERFVLASVPIDGGSAVVLNAPMPPNVDVSALAIAPDGARVVYLADALFSAPVDTSGLALEIAPFPAVFEITGDSARVVYTHDPGGINQVYSVPIDGSAAGVLLSTGLGGSRDAEDDFELVPDGSRVVYRADQLVNDVIELWGVPTDGSSAPVRLSPALVSGGDVLGAPRIDASGSRVVFRADAAVDQRMELWGAPVDGSAAAVKLNGALLGNEDVLPGFALAPEGMLAAFLTESPAGSKLFSAPIDASAAALLLETGAGVVFSDLEMSPNGLRLLYDRPDALGADLWSVPLDAGASALALSSGEDVSNRVLLPGGVLYIADEDERTVFELYARLINGSGSSLQISPEFPGNAPSGHVTSFTADGRHALYVADPGFPDVPGVYSVPVTGGALPLRVSATTGAPIHVTPSSGCPLTIGSGGARIVFAGHTVDGREIYSAPVDGSGEPVVLNAPLQALGSVDVLRLSGDGTRVVYLADQETDGRFELYRAEIDGSGSPVKLNAPLVAGSVHAGYLVSPDGSRVVYVAAQETAKPELFSADGVSAPVKLSGTLPAFAEVTPELLLSPDGAWVFYRADATTGGRYELFRAPLDGSASSVQLSGTLTSANDDSGSFLAPPDGARVVFVAWPAGTFDSNLYSVPSDGSAAPTRLNTLEPGPFGVSEFRVDPLGALVVFRNDSDEHRLYSVPIAGGVPEILLTPLAPDEYVLEGFQVSADGARVVYELDDDDCCSELFSVPIDGSQAPVQLDSLPQDAHVRRFLIDPAGGHVAFSTQASRLYRVAIGGGEPLEIEPSFAQDPLPLVAEDFVFAPGSSTLLYRALARENAGYDLFAAVGARVRKSGPPDPTIR